MSVNSSVDYRYYYVAEREGIPKPLTTASGEFVEYYTAAADMAKIRGFPFLIEVSRSDKGKLSIGEGLCIHVNFYSKHGDFIGWEYLKKVAEEFPEIIGLVEQVKALEFLRGP